MLLYNQIQEWTNASGCRLPRPYRRQRKLSPPIVLAVYKRIFKTEKGPKDEADHTSFEIVAECERRL